MNTSDSPTPVFYNRNLKDYCQIMFTKFTSIGSERRCIKFTIVNPLIFWTIEANQTSLCWFLREF